MTSLVYYRYIQYIQHIQLDDIVIFTDKKKSTPIQLDEVCVMHVMSDKVPFETFTGKAVSDGRHSFSRFAVQAVLRSNGEK